MNRFTTRGAAVATGLLLLWVLLTTGVLPYLNFQMGEDWFSIFRPASLIAAQGELPYGTVKDAMHPVHLYLMLVPFTHDPVASYPLWTAACGLLTLFATLVFVGGDVRAVTCVLTCPFLLIAVVQGQVTGVELFGLTLLYLALQRSPGVLPSAATGLALFVLAATPPNTLPLGLWAVYRDERPHLSLGVLAGLVGATVALYGLWFFAYLSFLADAPRYLSSRVNLTLWDDPIYLIVATGVVAALVIPNLNRFRRTPLPGQMLLILAATSLLSPYLLGHRLLPLYVLSLKRAATLHRAAPWGVLLFAYLLFLGDLYRGTYAGLLLFAPFAFCLALLSLEREDIVVPATALQ